MFDINPIAKALYNLFSENGELPYFNATHNNKHKI